MNSKIKVIANSRVNYLMVAGEDVVNGQMPIETALEIINKGTETRSTLHPGYALCIDGKYFFETYEEKSTKGQKPITKKRENR